MRVVVGLSGGVDSSVAAYLLKEQGHEVIALFMINWHDTTGTLHGDCPWEDDKIFAELVARKLGIPFHVVDLSEQYQKRVVDYMFEEYARGRTPNPDVLCNREIKFDHFIEAAGIFNPDFVATGHYARKDSIEKNGNTVYRLKAGVDNNKDQSYFLCQLTQKQLEKALFPLGEIKKPQVREIAAKLNLASAEKKDSQGICFVGKVNLPEFLQQQLESKEGRIICIPEDHPAYMNACQNSDFEIVTKKYQYIPNEGTNVGTHSGAHFFTIGQRKGLNVGGMVKPLYVIDTDVDLNIVYVGEGDDHPGLYRKGLFIPDRELHWVRSDLEMQPGEKGTFLARIRYRQALQKATLHRENTGMYVIFDEPQRGIAPGQFAAWYDGVELIGSGVIA